MLKQYPHYLFEVKPVDSMQDENGNWTEAVSTKDFVSMCREETNSSGAELQLAGGVYHRFNSLIQLPKGAEAIAVGANVIVANDAEGDMVRVSGEVLKFDAGQLHSRLWI